MSFLDRFRRSSSEDSSNDSAEQLAPDDPAPRGESRDTGTASVFTYLFNRDSSVASSATVESERTDPPTTMDRHWNNYYKGFPFTRAALQNFSRSVAEPGYQIRATVERDGERVTDDEMSEALRKWASNCAIHAGEINQDLSVLLRENPSQRRGRGTALLEKVGTEGDPNALRALVYHDPSTFKIYRRENQNVLIQPDDDVEPDHPRTPPTENHPEGAAAAYVQYDDDITGYDDIEPIAFSQDDIVKFVYDADVGECWGSSIFEACDDRIDALKQKWEDRDTAIHTTGHPHRIYYSPEWTHSEAGEYATAHREGDISVWADDEDRGTFAGRVDFIGGGDMEITTEHGSVADIEDAVLDDIRAIFSVMPVSRFKIAYEENINQFVIEPQQDDDDQRVDDERRYLESKFGPIFEEKADELAGGEYDGEVSFRIEPDKEDNILQRESFPRENLEALGSFFRDYYSSGAASDFPPGYLGELLGTNLEEIQEEYGFEPEQFTTEEIDELAPGEDEESAGSESAEA
ncbi:hypothetical protein [Halocatena halophila]|uniref:hypothetical protein n=1 Tax=Halocatena halophila TaxID=2814576 RepID=UPI002ED580E7